MPRGKLQLKLIDDRKKRKSTYRKRIIGLKQKTYELSTLCAVDAFMISYGPSGEAETWPQNRQEIRDAIARYSGRSADAQSRNKSRFTDAPTMEALELRLRRVRARIELLGKQRGEEIFSWMDYGQEGILCPDASNSDSTVHHLSLLPPADTGFPQFPPELFLDELEEMIGPYVDLASPPTDAAGFGQLPPEPCLDVSCYSQVASDHDRFFTPFGQNDVQSWSRTLGGFPQLSSEDCFDVTDMMGVDDHDLMYLSPSGLGNGRDSGLLGQNSSELFASDWPVDDTGFDDPHYFTNGPMDCPYDDLEDLGSQPCRLWTF